MSTNSPILHLQGFRGVAIFLIILFHLCPSICPNGFFGVDAFLVLSGYFLIGKQLKDHATFSFPEFARKKVMRLFPPVIIVVSGIALLASLLPEVAMKDILDQVPWALCGISNIKLAEVTNDYFAADTQNMPLMHLWYLGCIIQCYLFFALLFVAWHLFRFRLRGKLISLGVIFLFSLAVRYQALIHTFGWGGSEYLVSTYYMTTARLWELITGGVLMILPNYSDRFPRLSGVLSVLAGAAFCLIAFLPFSDSTQYIPLAVLLSAILLLCQEHGLFVRLLNQRAILFLGSISFSLYLVHWPIICFTSSFFGIQLTPVTAIAELGGMVLFGFILRQLAEKRISKGLTIVCLYLGCWGLWAILLHTGSLRSFFSANLLDVETLSYNPVVADIDQPLYADTEGLPVQWSRDDGKEPSLIYHLGDPTQEATFVLLGDSHSENLIAGFDLNGRERGWAGIYLNSYFSPFWGALYEEAGQPKHTFDRTKGETFLRWFKAHPKITHVVIALHWSTRMRDHLTWDGLPAASNQEQALECRYKELKTFCELMEEQGKRVILLADAPYLKGHNPAQYVLRKRLKGDNNFSEPDYICTQEEYDKRNAAFMQCAERLEQEGKCTLLRMGDALLQDGTFCCMKGNMLLMIDSHHLSRLGGREAIKLIADDFMSALSQP